LLVTFAARVERAPPPAAFDFDSDLDLDFDLDLEAHPNCLTALILLPQFSHCSDDPGFCTCGTDTPVRCL
jgi:hypothetical protein